MWAVQDNRLCSTRKRFQEFIFVQSPRRWIQWHIHRDTSGQFNARLVRFVSRVEEQNLIPLINCCKDSSGKRFRLPAADDEVRERVGVEAVVPSRRLREDVADPLHMPVLVEVGGDGGGGGGGAGVVHR